jgi:hypothetical protein
VGDTRYLPNQAEGLTKKLVRCINKFLEEAHDEERSFEIGIAVLITENHARWTKQEERRGIAAKEKVIEGRREGEWDRLR